MLDRIASVITQAGCYLLLIPVCYTGNRWLFVRNTDAYTALTSIITGVLSQIGCYSCSSSTLVGVYRLIVSLVIIDGYSKENAFVITSGGVVLSLSFFHSK